MCMVGPPVVLGWSSVCLPYSGPGLRSPPLCLTCPETPHVLHPLRDVARLEALILPAGPSPAAYVCCGALCSAPAQEAGDLVVAVDEMGRAAGRMGDVGDHVSADPDAAD